jgi:hypothetical protein
MGTAKILTHYTDLQKYESKHYPWNLGIRVTQESIACHMEKRLSKISFNSVGSPRDPCRAICLWAPFSCCSQRTLFPVSPPERTDIAVGLARCHGMPLLKQNKSIYTEVATGRILSPKA